MDEPTRCGEGLAHNAVLPEKLSELMAAMADVLSQHVESLLLEDAGARSEQAAYEQVIALQRRMSVLGRALADDMREFASLLPARHDFERVGRVAMTATFRDFARRKEELCALLTEQLEQDRATVAAMAGVKP